MSPQCFICATIDAKFTWHPVAPASDQGPRFLPPLQIRGGFVKSMNLG